MTLSSAARRRLIRLLLDGTPKGPQPTIDSVVAWKLLQECETAYFKGEQLRDRAHAPTPAKSVVLIDKALRALSALKAGAGADTLNVTRPHLAALRDALVDRRDTLKGWQLARNAGLTCDDGQPIRKPDARTESMRVLGGHLGFIWGLAAVDRSNRNKRRRFAMAFLDAAGIEHPGASHPATLDQWLDSGAGPLSQEANRAAAVQARKIMAACAKLPRK